MTLPSRVVVGAHLQWLRHRSAIHAPNQKHWSGTSGNMSALVEAGGKREAYVPVLLLWAFPAVIVVGSVRYYSGRAVHKAELLEAGKGPDGRPARFEIDWHHVRRLDLDGYLDGGCRGGGSRDRLQRRIFRIGR